MTKRVVTGSTANTPALTPTNMTTRAPKLAKSPPSMSTVPRSVTKHAACAWQSLPARTDIQVERTRQRAIVVGLDICRPGIGANMRSGLRS